MYKQASRGICITFMLVIIKSSSSWKFHQIWISFARVNHGIGITTFFGAIVSLFIINHPLVKLSLAVIKGLSSLVARRISCSFKANRLFNSLV